MLSMDIVRKLNTKLKVILASNSKPRAKLLQQMGLEFEAVPSRFPENLESTTLSPAEYAIATANRKAEAVLSYLTSLTQNLTIIIACDTIIVNDSLDIIEKALDENHAERILLSLSGKTHEVVTGVSLILYDNDTCIREQFSDRTEVTFGDLSAQEVKEYLDSKEWIEKAGAYAIQSRGSLFVQTINGDYNNVIGLPLRRVLTAIRVMLDRYHDSVGDQIFVA